jgi:uncharacterized iron-regulated membrane protein
MAKTFNRRIFSMHSWLGLINGSWLLILGLSGAMLVYYQDVDRWLNKDILRVVPGQQHLPLDTLFNIVRARHPEAGSAGILRFPESQTDCYSFRLYGLSPRKTIYYNWDLYQVDINPYNGKILREGYYRNAVGLLHWIFTFHYSLHMGTPGMLVITLAGLLLFTNIITGIIIYKKYVFKALVLRAPVKWKNWRTGASGLHRYIGVWALLFNVMIFFSGIEMTWNVFYKESWIIKQLSPKNDRPYANLDKILHAVQEIYPGFEPTFMHIPFTKRDDEKQEEHIAVYGNIPGTPRIISEGSSNVIFNTNTGEVISKRNINEAIKTMNIWQKFDAVAYSFHVGSFAGSYSKVFYLFVGLSPAILSITGFMLWWRRKNYAQKRPKDK